MTTTTNKIAPNMAKQVWPFCTGCGVHRKSAAFRASSGTVRCDACAVTRRILWPWRQG
jgi:hypothetical protein